jgi:hypothetical protein
MWRPTVLFASCIIVSVAAHQQAKLTATSGIVGDVICTLVCGARMAATILVRHRSARHADW